MNHKPLHRGPEHMCLKYKLQICHSLHFSSILVDKGEVGQCRQVSSDMCPGYNEQTGRSWPCRHYRGSPWWGCLLYIGCKGPHLNQICMSRQLDVEWLCIQHFLHKHQGMDQCTCHCDRFDIKDIQNSKCIRAYNWANLSMIPPRLGNHQCHQCHQLQW